MTAGVLVIGGANIDFAGFSDKPLLWHDSNPGKVKTSLGGVGRNIAENLSRLGVKTQLLSLVGCDTNGQRLLDETRAAGVDVCAVQMLEGYRTSSYFSIMDNDEDMAVAIADMAIFDALTPEKIQPYQSLIESASLVVLDTNLPRQSLQYLLTKFKETPFLVDTVSVTKTQKLAGLIDKIDILKPNRLEAQLLTGITIHTLEDAYRSVDALLAMGIKQVFLSMGVDGLLYADKDQKQHCLPFPTKVVNATGAGDSVMASIAYGHVRQLAISQTLRFASAVASLTLSADSTIHPQLSETAVLALLDQCQ